MNNLDNVTSVSSSVDAAPTMVAEAPKPSGGIKKMRRGFAAMDRNQVKMIASMGGKAAHEKGTAHRWNKEEAVAAGKKGGTSFHKSRGGRRKTVTSSSNSVESEIL